MRYFANMFPELFGDAEDGMERFQAYQARRNANPDNERMSKLRCGPGEDGVQRLRGHDRFGGYFVVGCNVDEQNPNDSQPWFRPGRNGWDRPHKNGSQTDWVNPECPCFTSVNPPPRWWVTENIIEVSEAQRICPG
ncbi:uncharacterized protein N7483_002146 [Penicillium malachiteum]|uniref:uncharacterized protein n=1 Tax=Penicillium malachiteum TaxID=1324776 RepID=UPI0025477A85|nr:uncharacterized protein N7483_002146 [Penicillium malachiteum]KAJ5737021.1 hypothetical protein N7483_002146 [Penicillium malachiteum]